MHAAPETRLPVIIQGGMGVGISSWRLASAVAAAGQLGVVSGTALDAVLARRLQDGDPDGSRRAAMAAFPVPAVAERALEKWFRPEGRQGRPYLPVPRLGLRPNPAREELAVLGNFVEVWLAKQGHSGTVGINYLEKIQMALPAAAYGAVLAGVDYVLVGAGIPRELPALLRGLAEHRPSGVHVDVIGAEPHWHEFDPAVIGAPAQPLRVPRFLAIVSSHVLAAYLSREDATRPDGIVVEGPTAGGHNAPPRGQLRLDESGQPVYGPRDEADLGRVAAVGLPFWLAGGYGEPERVAEAVAAGAAGVQIGTLFALSEESGLDEPLRERLLAQLREDAVSVRTEGSASPTGFPFKVAQLSGTLSDADRYEERPRLCDLGYLRQPYAREGGAVGYRCPAEPIDVYVRKGGEESATPGSQCLCNGLMANTGLGQQRRDGYEELPLVTLGADLAGARRLQKDLAAEEGTWSARQAVDWLLSLVPAGQDVTAGQNAPGATPAPNGDRSGTPGARSGAISGN